MTSKYRRLLHVQSTDEAVDDEKSAESRPRWSSYSLRKYYALCLGSLFIASIMLNTAFLFRLLILERGTCPVITRSTFANLSSKIPLTVHYSTEYGPDYGNRTTRDQLWSEINFDDGVVALSDQWADEHQIPRSERFPWDHSKGIYILAAYHKIHCLKTMQRYISYASRGSLLASGILHHVEHCLDTFLQDVYCHADDLPLFQLPLDKGGLEAHAGDLQTRECRDFRELEIFSKKNSACYREDPGIVTNELDFYKFCSENSPYYEAMTNHFAKNLEN